MDQTTDFELVAERVAKNLMEYLRDFDKVAEYAYSVQYKLNITLEDYEHLITIL